MIIREVWWQGVPDSNVKLADRIQSVVDEEERTGRSLVAITPMPVVIHGEPQCVLLTFSP